MIELVGIQYISPGITTVGVVIIAPKRGYIFIGDLCRQPVS
jgi:hypothetical protein